MEQDSNPQDGGDAVMDTSTDPTRMTVPPPSGLDVVTSASGPGEEPAQPVAPKAAAAIVAWVAAHIASGILQRLGGAIFDRIFPSFTQAEQQNLINNLAARFREIVEEEAVRRAGTSLDSLMRKMMDYYATAGGSIDRLEQSTSHAQDLVAELKNLRLAGFGSFLGAAGLDLAVIQARYFNPQTHDEGEKHNALTHIQDAVNHVNDMSRLAISRLDARFGEVRLISVGTVRYTYILDGESAGIFLSFRDAEEARNRKHKEELDLLSADLLDPAVQVRDKWLEIAWNVPSWWLSGRPVPIQSNWRWCYQCQGLFYGGNEPGSVCPAGGPHANAGAGIGDYNMRYDGPQEAAWQSDWRWCNKCQGLFFGGHIPSSVCPVGGAHDDVGSGNYNVRYDGLQEAGWQSGWRWCNKCQGLSYGWGESSSICPAGGPHASFGSADYSLTQVS